MLQAQAIVGLFVICLVSWSISENRRRWPLREIVVGLGLQFLLALILLHVGPARRAIDSVNDVVGGLQRATDAGTDFVFGYLGGGELPFMVTGPGNSLVLAFQVMPLILVISALTAVLTHWRLLPWIVRAFAHVLQRPFGIGGAVGLGAAANIFVGMVEAPLFVRAYLARMPRSDLFTLMCTGMATIAGTVLFIYARLIGQILPGAAGHLLVASVISAPAAIMIARIIVPPDAGATRAADVITPPRYSSTMDAVTQGTQSGLMLYLNILAMLLVLVALVSLVNMTLGLLPAIGGEPLSLERLFGWLLSPLAWLIGIPWHEAGTAGSLLGTKTVLNEFLAYEAMAGLPAAALSEHSRLILAYALCGFANFGSLGIMIGGLATLVPQRRAEIVGLGMRSIVGGTLATASTGAIVGLIAG